MTELRPIAAGLFALIAALATVAAAEPPAVQPLPVESDWGARASAWFDAEDDAGRRTEMRAVTRALRQPCRYCHTPDFTGYTDKRLIAQQMMALSAEHDVPCADCHAGRDGLTTMGQKAAPMWALARQKGVFCGTCHVKHRRFEALSEAGQRFRDAEWEAWRAAHGAAAAPSPPSPALPMPATPATTPPAGLPAPGGAAAPGSGAE